MAFEPGEFEEITRRLWGSDASLIIAKRLGINLRTVQRWHAGTGSPVPEKVEHMIREQAALVAEHLNCSRIIAELDDLKQRGAWTETIKTQIDMAWVSFRTHLDD